MGSKLGEPQSLASFRRYGQALLHRYSNRSRQDPALGGLSLCENQKVSQGSEHWGLEERENHSDIQGAIPLCTTLERL